MTCCIVNVAVGGSYPRGQARLLRSLKAVAADTPRIFYDGWPGKSHQDCQYGFKVDACLDAKRRGYERVLWLDSQVIAVAPLDLVWRWLDAHPILLLEDSWNLGQWTAEHALALFGATRDAALQIPLCWAKVVAIDLLHFDGTRFLERWQDLRDAGAFNGPWAVIGESPYMGHRHDQSCASWLAWDMGLPMAPKADFVSSWPDASGPVFVVKGNRLG